MLGQSAAELWLRATPPDFQSRDFYFACAVNGTVLHTFPFWWKDLGKYFKNKISNIKAEVEIFYIKPKRCQHRFFTLIYVHVISSASLYPPWGRGSDLSTSRGPGKQEMNSPLLARRQPALHTPRSHRGQPKASTSPLPWALDFCGQVDACLARFQPHRRSSIKMG